ncbi:TadE family protein [Streptacidiphilus anmyonensis]|uniref:TadE/TadG family type IV pilus assembly protein n=1 Tax=Streptacidiphilus anmyonensis TaxID=405782 RepID=UPI0009FCE199
MTRRPPRRRRPPQRIRLHGRGLDGADRGALSLELAILAPVVMLLLFTIVQAGFYFYTRDVAVTAAQQGVETARVHGGTLGEGEAQTWDLLHRTGGSITGPAVSGSQTGANVTITVTGSVTTWIPGLTFHLSQTATAAKEQLTR